MSNKKLLRGALILSLAGLLSKFLGIFFKIPLQKLIGDEGMGLFGLPYPLYTLMLSISITGFPAAISKLISEKISYGDRDGANKIFTTSLFMLILVGLFSSGVLFFGAEYIIDLLNWPEAAYYSIRGLAIAPLFVSIMSAFRGYFQGFQIMGPTAISQIVEQIGRVVIGIGLSYYTISKGVGYAAGSASFGASAGAILGCTTLAVYYIVFKKQLNRGIQYSSSYKKDTLSIWYIVRQITWFAIPISIGSLLSSIMTLIDAIMVPARLMDAGYSVEHITVLYGQLTGKAVTLVNVPLTLSIAMAASVIPSIAESYSRKNVLEIRNKIETSIKVTIAIGLPATIGLSMLAPQIIELLWGKGELGGDILRILAFNVIFISLAQVLGSILQGIDRVFIPLRNLMVGSVVKILVSYYLINSSIGILGAVIGSILGYFIVMLLNYRKVKQHTGFKLNVIESIIKPAVLSMMMVFAIDYSHSYLSTRFISSNIVTIFAILVGMIVYLSGYVVFCGTNFKFDN